MAHDLRNHDFFKTYLIHQKCTQEVYDIYQTDK